MPTSQRLPGTNERILEEVRLKLALAREHLNALAEFGLTAEWLNELESAADAAEMLPTYEMQMGEMRSLTAAKDEALAECVQWGRKLRYRMQLAFADKTPTGMQFPVNDWRAAERNESKAIATFPSLIQLARQHATLLASVGQTEATITQGEELFTTLKAANEAQEQYKYSRTTITNERREAFERLYEGILRINQTGQMVYGKDTARGNLFRSNWSSPSSRNAAAEEE